MILRMLTLAGGLSGAAAVSQFPEFSQQYVQRLGGAVDALEQVVADFDASAAAEGLSRADALAQMTGSGFVERRRADMERSIARFDSLRAQQINMRTAGPFMRAYHMQDVDRDIARAAWADFQPAVPLNMAGGLFGGIGFVAGSLSVSLVAGTLAGLHRRRRRHAT